MNKTANSLAEVAARIREMREIMGFSVSDMAEKTEVVAVRLHLEAVQHCQFGLLVRKVQLDVVAQYHDTRMPDRRLF